MVSVCVFGPDWSNESLKTKASRIAVLRLADVLICVCRINACVCFCPHLSQFVRICLHLSAFVCVCPTYQVRQRDIWCDIKTRNCDTFCIVMTFVLSDSFDQSGPNRVHRNILQTWVLVCTNLLMMTLRQEDFGTPETRKTKSPDVPGPMGRGPCIYRYYQYLLLPRTENRDTWYLRVDIDITC